MPIPSPLGKIAVAFLLLFSSLYCHASQTPGTTYSVGVLNQQSVVATAELWNPLLLYLSKKTGARFVLAIGSTVQQTDARTAKGEFDLVYTNHIFDMPIEREYRPLVRWGGASLRGILVSLRPRTLRDLADQTIAFPSREAFAATILTWTRLQQDKIAFRPVYTGSQQACLAALVKGVVAVASVTPRFAAPYAARHGLKLHVLYRSPAFPQIPLLAHKTRVPRELAQRVRKTLLDMPSDREGKALLTRLGIPPFLPADDALYAGTRGLYTQWRRLRAGATSQ